jgi:hypothetical protein
MILAIWNILLVVVSDEQLRQPPLFVNNLRKAVFIMSSSQLRLSPVQAADTARPKEFTIAVA